MTVAVITGAGLCCALGRSFAAAAAGYGAGERMFVKDPAVIAPDGLPLRLAPVFGFHEIHNYQLRLERLFQAALDDLPATPGAPSVPLRLVVPGWMEGRPILSHTLAAIAETNSGRFSEIQAVSADGSTVLAELARGLDDINSARHGELIVGALDSLLHAEVIDMLALENRIFTRANPFGLTPSEAAVLFRLAPDSEDTAIGVMQGAWNAHEPLDPVNPDGIPGRVLSGIFSEAARTLRPDRLMMDGNGERWRSAETAFVFSSCDGLSEDQTVNFEDPVLYTGYAGCATGGVMAALALGPRARHYWTEDGRPASGDDDHEWTLVSISEYNGLRSVALIGRPVTASAKEIAA